MTAPSNAADLLSQVEMTKHADARLNQRGLSRAQIDAVLAFGDDVGDKITLTARDARKRMEALRREMRALEAIAQKGGVTAVVQDGHLITAYRASSYTPSKARKRAKAAYQSA